MAGVCHIIYWPSFSLVYLLNAWCGANNMGVKYLQLSELNAYLQYFPAPFLILCVISDPVEIEERFHSFRSLEIVPIQRLEKLPGKIERKGVAEGNNSKG